MYRCLCEGGAIVAVMGLHVSLGVYVCVRLFNFIHSYLLFHSLFPIVLLILLPFQCMLLFATVNLTCGWVGESEREHVRVMLMCEHEFCRVLI